MQKIERYLRIMMVFTVIDVVAKIIFTIREYLSDNKQQDDNILEFLDE
jgi:hypothetical protein